VEHWPLASARRGWFAYDLRWDVSAAVPRIPCAPWYEAFLQSALDGEGKAPPVRPVSEGPL